MSIPIQPEELNHLPIASNPLLSTAMNKSTSTTSWFKQVTAEISC
ncbi:MAG: hypothetical protein RMY36_029015 [Nostoc sp. SerVER01]